MQMLHTTTQQVRVLKLSASAAAQQQLEGRFLRSHPAVRKRCLLPGPAETRHELLTGLHVSLTCYSSVSDEDSIAPEIFRGIQ